MLSILCVRLTIKVKAGIPESFKVGWYPLKKTGSSHLKYRCRATSLTLLTGKIKDSHAIMVKKSYTNKGLFTRREGYPCAVENALNSRNKGKILSS